LGDDLGRYADSLGLIELDGVTATACTDEVVDLAGQVSPVVRARAPDLERRVIQRQLGDGQAARGGAHGEYCS